MSSPDLERKRKRGEEKWVLGLVQMHKSQSQIQTTVIDIEVIDKEVIEKGVIEKRDTSNSEQGYSERSH